MELVLFIAFGAVAVATGAYVIIAKNPINSAVSLIVTFLSLAGIYVLLHAHFLAVIQILVYAGAIMVLFLFVIMLLNLNDKELGERRIDSFKVLGGLLAIALVAILLSALIPSQTVTCQPDGDCAVAGEGFVCIDVRERADGQVFGYCTPEAVEVSEEFGGIKDVGAKLFEDYLLPFEVVSITLLVAIVGALLIAKKRA